MNRKLLWLFSLGLLCVLAAVLGSAQLIAQRDFLEQGREEVIPQPVADTGMSRLCVNAALEQYTEAELAWALGYIDQGGYTWVRQRFPWSEIEVAPEDFQWERWDRIVAGAVEQGIQLIPVLDSPPAWAGMTPSPEAFAHFAGAFANHYMAQMVYYEVWHNPNLGEAWGGAADPYVYTELLALASKAIHASDPDARIILGSLAPNVEMGPNNYAESYFLEMLYVAGAAPYFDVVALQPYGFYSGPDDRRAALDVMNFSRPLLVREVLEAHGEGEKAIWASHFGWNSLPNEWEGPTSIWGHVDEATQAVYTVEALARVEQEWPWMGVMCLNGFQPRPAASDREIPDAEEHWGFALVGPDEQPRPVYTAVQEWAVRPQRAVPGVYPAGTGLADFEGSWRIGPLGADIGESGDRVRLDFEGTGVALTVRRGSYRAFLYVTVDGKPAPSLPRDEAGRAYLVLYDPLAEIATVPLAEHLPYGVHTVEVMAELGWGQWALADWRVLNEPERGAYLWGIAGFCLLGVAGFILSLVSARRLDWSVTLPRLMVGVNRLNEWGKVALTLALGLAFGLTTWLTWTQGIFRRLGEGSGMIMALLAAGLFYFSPWFLLSLVSGALLFLLVFAYPGMGLALVIAAAPFYLHPVSLFGKSFSLSELVLLPTLVGCGIRIASKLKRQGEERHAGVPKSWSLVKSGLFSLPSFSAVATFVLVAAASALFAEHSHEAMRELRLVVIEPVLFYFALIATPMTKRERWRIVDFFILGAVVVAGIGLVQYFILGDVITAEGGFRRLRSIYGSPNNVGLYLGRVLPILMAMVFWGKENDRPSELRSLLGSRQGLYAVAVIPIGSALLLSFSRGAILLGIPAALLMLGFLAGGRWRKITFIMLLLFLLALIPLFRTPRFAGLLNPEKGTTFLRLSLWRSAWRMFLDHPVLGVGPDNFLYAYRTRYVLPSAWEEFNLSHPHNWLLDFASRMGILGLSTFLWLQATFWLCAFSLRQWCKSRRTCALSIGMMASMVAALAHGLVDASYFYIDLAYSFFFAFAVVVWLREELC